MKNLILVSILLACALSAKAQTPLYPTQYTVAGLPAAATMRGRVVNVTDGARPGDCKIGGGTARTPCISTGTEYIPWAGYSTSNAVDVRDFGAKCDDTTDDATAIQNAINSLGSTSTSRNGPEIVIPNKCAIGSTVVIDRKTIVFRGLGWGRRVSGGVQSYLRWIGAAGIPMLKIQNIQGLQIRDLRFVGNATNKPSAAISSTNVAGFGINSNVIQNVAIGDLNDETGLGIQFVNGIAFEGSSGNNAEWRIYNTSINGCSGYGIRQSSIQQINHYYAAIEISNCTTGGVYIVSTANGNTWDFGANGTDIVLARTDDFGAATVPHVTVQSLDSERSARLADFQGAGFLNITSSNFQIGSFTASDGKIILMESDRSNWLTIRDATLDATVSSPTTTPFIAATEASYTSENFKDIVLEHVSLSAGGPDGTGIDARSKGVLDIKHIRFTPTGNGSSASYVVAKAVDMWIGGVNGGEGGVTTRTTTDVPSRFRFMPTFYQQITAASDTVLLDTSLRLLYNNSGGPLTLTSTPTIPVGRNGEVLTLINVSSQPITLQDDAATLAGTKLKLLSPRITLAQRESAQFIYLTTDGTGFVDTNKWIQIGGSQAEAQEFNPQTGTSYTIVAGDNRKFLTLNNGSAIAVTLPQATGSFTTGWTIDIGTIGAGTATITPTTSTINASAIGGSSAATSITITTGHSVRLVSNGTNYVLYNYQGRY